MARALPLTRDDDAYYFIIMLYLVYLTNQTAVFVDIMGCIQGQIQGGGGGGGGGMGLPCPPPPPPSGLSKC